MSERVQPKPAHWNNNRPHFYKYMSLDTAKIVIANRTLRFSRPALLNDPFDMGFDLQLHIDPETLIPKIIDVIWDAHYGENPPPPRNALGVLIAFARDRFPRMDREQFVAEFGEVADESLEKMRDLKEFHREIRQFMATTKVLCLTEAPDNVLMWAHYAQAHTGVVIRLRSIPERDSMFGIAKPIQYLDQMPVLMNDNEIVALLSGSGSVAEAGLLDKLVYTKSSHWAHEREWRISIGMGWEKEKELEDVKFGPDELDAVIFGTMTPPDQREAITRLAQSQNPDVSLYRVRPSPDKFAFEVVKVGRD